MLLGLNILNRQWIYNREEEGNFGMEGSTCFIVNSGYTCPMTTIFCFVLTLHLNSTNLNLWYPDPVPAAVLWPARLLHYGLIFLGTRLQVHGRAFSIGARARPGRLLTGDLYQKSPAGERLMRSSLICLRFRAGGAFFRNVQVVNVS